MYDEEAPRFLIGDKGFQLQETMLVPIREDQVRTEAEKLFNRIFGKLRVRGSIYQISP